MNRRTKQQLDLLKLLVKKGITLEKITNMTGISAPYEESENPDLVIETDRLTSDQSVDSAIRFLVENNMLMV